MPSRKSNLLKTRLVLCALLVGDPVVLSARQRVDAQVPREHHAIDRLLNDRNPDALVSNARTQNSNNESLLNASAVFSGAVTDSASKPIVGAEVSIPSLGLSAKTDAEGRYRIVEIPSGIHRVVARAVGYVAVTASLVFVDGETETRRFILERVSLLDSVNVNARILNDSEADFEARRRSGIGTFLTREQLGKYDEESLTRILPRLPGARVIRGSGNRAWIASLRFNGGPGREGKIAPGRSDSMNGARPNCYAKVYVDNVVRYGGSDGEPLFDAASMQIADVESIEYFAGSAQTPAQYGGLGASCGVLLIWTRKSRTQDD